MKTFEKIDSILTNARRLLIVLHDNPDPDAIASGWALKHLIENRFHIQATITYGGIIGRSENRAMVRLLKIPLKPFKTVRLATYDRIALIDTQPGAGNNSLPTKTPCHLIIDHHPRRKDLKSAVAVIDNEIGATATLLVEWLVDAQCEIHSGLATSLTYAIRSETQDLGREVSERDVQAYLRVLPKSTMRKLAKIILPKLPNTYFIQLNDTLKTARIFRNLIFAYLGTIPYPEIVAEMADLLLKHERISWSFCAGQYGNELHLSLRSSNPKANAGKLIKKLVSDKNAAGGHDTFAGGKIIINGNDALENLDIAEKLSKKFASLMGYPGAEWRLLTES